MLGKELSTQTGKTTKKYNLANLWCVLRLRYDIAMNVFHYSFGKFYIFIFYILFNIPIAFDSITPQVI